MPAHYLLKAEPTPRLERGVDISFPFTRLLTSPGQSTEWEGVRNPVAGKLLGGMHLGDLCFWYHSNCRLPSIVGVVRVCAAPRPDYTAFDEKHPYYDAKSTRESPRWYMPDVQYERALQHEVPLALLQHIAGSGSGSGALTQEQRRDVPYLNDEHIAAIASMDLLRLGRLSVQRVEDKAWEAVNLLGERGGWQGKWKGKWDQQAGSKKGSTEKGSTKKGSASASAAQKGKRKRGQEQQDEETVVTKAGVENKAKANANKAALPPPPQQDGLRRSTRTRR